MKILKAFLVTTKMQDIGTLNNLKFINIKKVGCACMFKFYSKKCV